MTDKIQEIRKALEAATPGPWRYNGNEVVAVSNPRVGIAGAMSEEDCELIANAPEWLSYLIDQVEHARGCAEEAWRNECDYEELIGTLQQQLDAAKQENGYLHEEIDSNHKRLKQAIEALEAVYNFANERREINIYFDSIAGNIGAFLSIIREEAGNGPKAIDPTEPPSEAGAEP